MNQEDLTQLRVDLSRSETLIQGLANDVRVMATAIKDVAEANQVAIGGLRKALDTRANQGRTHMISTLGIILPIVVIIFGVLWSADATMRQDLKELYDVRIQAAYENGRRDGLNQDTRDRLERIEDQVQRLSQEKH